MWEEAFQRIKEATDSKFPLTSQDKDSCGQEVGSGERDPDVEGEDNAPSPARTVQRIQGSKASAGTPLSQFSISPPNLEVPGHFLDFSLSPSGCSGSDWRLLGSMSYSEASDSWERYFSEISVTLITGPLRFFFFRDGVLERPDLGAVVLHRDCTALTTVAEGWSIRFSSPSTSLW